MLEILAAILLVILIFMLGINEPPVTFRTNITTKKPPIPLSRKKE